MSEQPKRRGNGGNPNWVKGGPSPNPKGRNAGAREAISRELLNDMAVAWELYGPEALRQMASTDPSSFVRAYVGLLPKEVKVDAMENMTEEQLLARIKELAINLELEGVLLPDGSAKGGETKH